MTALASRNLAEFSAAISPPRAEDYAQANQHLNRLTKPLGSLGFLETIAAKLFAIYRGKINFPLSKAIYVFAADHGITSEGVSAYPREVTAQMVQNFVAGGAAINVLTNLHGIELTVVDVGVDALLEDAPRLYRAKVRHGSRNFLSERAMNEEELSEALEVGFTMARRTKDKGQQLVAAGEMGIGNTTAASAITAALTKRPAEEVTGRGTGLDDTSTTRKAIVIQQALKFHFEERKELDPLEILAAVGGLEIAAMTGFYLGSAREQRAIVCDGFISTAAAALACGIAPQVKEYLFSGHRSQEPGHRYLLEHLGLRPILNLDMRLGEGTGAALAMPIIESSLRVYSEMATFASAGVSEANS
jgi:nicotinate-nucleotide--dimethylbenzimidazole phosphoribosyltransferase